MEPPKPEPTDPTPDRIRALMDDLVSENGVDRMAARRQLRGIGDPALPLLHGLLQDPRSRARWEAAKVVSAIASPTSADALAGALCDEESGVRWLTATGLLAMGREGVLAVLRTVARTAMPERCRSAAHHVLHDLEDEEMADAVAPVVDAIENYTSSARVMVSAQEALFRLERPTD